MEQKAVKLRQKLLHCLQLQQTAILCTKDRRKIQPAGKPGLFYPLHKRTQLSGIYPVSSGAGHQQVHVHPGNFSRLPHNCLQLIQRLDRYSKLHLLLL